MENDFRTSSKRFWTTIQRLRRGKQCIINIVYVRTVVCEHSVANLQCDEGKVLFIYGADYGRHDKTTCALRPARWLQNVHCSRPTTKVAESCNGKRSCTVKASNSVFGDPCYGTYKYLDVTFACLPPVRRTVACEGSVANLQCGEGKVISVLGADYGRPDKTTCSLHGPASQIQNVHCSRPTSKVAESCNGKRNCTVNANNSVFGDPCYGTYKYLEVAYRCQCE
ncbi:L-rhamnose-binding lectin CSL3-like [Scomber japonicus]|uniref:L-rhamnose-binding lectin CSL3-like n=1 Tax=Scomber japonicus TaxID=13676 RepID=UPI0023058999|nr:L-rhamnose-binding lectin CSL3-like [Scomber japonicus]